MKTGILAELEVIPVPTQLSDAERRLYNKFTDRIQSAFAHCGQNIQRWPQCRDLKDEPIGLIGLKAMNQRKALLGGCEAKVSEALRIIQSHAGSMVIVFSERIPSIEKLHQLLEKNRIRSATFHSKVPPWKKTAILDNWGETFEVLLSVKSLEEGLDVKDVSVGILLTSGKGKNQFTQRIGRIVRPKEGKQAKLYVLFAPNTFEEQYSRTIRGLLKT